LPSLTAGTQGTLTLGDKKPSPLKRLSIFIPIVMLPLGAWLGYRAFEEYTLADIGRAVAGIPSIHFILALVFAAGSYTCLSGFDALGVRYTGHALPYWKIALTSFISLGIGHNVGVAFLSSGALRYRFYSSFGLSTVDVGKVILFCGMTVALGLMSLGGLILLVHPEVDIWVIDLSAAAGRGIGALCLGLVAIYPLLAWRLRREVNFRGHRFRLPDVATAIGQIVVGTANFAFVAATLHQLLAGVAPYTQVVSAYVLGNVAGLLSHVPGGLGVLEFVVSSVVAQGNVVGALIAFRIMYFLIPLILASILLFLSEAIRWRAK